MSVVPRRPRPPVPTWAQPWIFGFVLSLRAEGRADLTISRYRDAAGWFAGWLAGEHPDVQDWADVKREHLREFFAWMRDTGYSPKYTHNIGGSIQAFYKWYSAEEDLPDLFDLVKPPAAPKLGATPPPVIVGEQLGALLKDAERGRDFESRRDAALIRVFASTGGRLSEIALLGVDAVDLEAREITVVGKGAKTRVVKIDHRATRSLDRYLRVRAKHTAVVEYGCTALWIGTRRRGGMTASGVRQAIQRRGERLGIHVHPHLFRHTFAHRWLDAGGAEGDLMELAGWESTQMLRHYGRSARSARARRAYDRVDVMGGI